MVAQHTLSTAQAGGPWFHGQANDPAVHLTGEREKTPLFLEEILDVSADEFLIFSAYVLRLTFYKNISRISGRFFLFLRINIVAHA